ncbi:MAG: TonB-dependent receptor plug domain-containing protein [Brevundimonas sp.]
MLNYKTALLGTTIVAGLLSGGGLLFAPTAALAQAAATTPDQPVQTDEGEAELDEIVVVGSRIRRDTYNSPSPVQVITREETTLAGYNSTTEALQGTAVTGGASQINNAYGGYVTDGGPGANTLSLRGLGAGRSLVLLNGRRVAPAGSRGSVGSADLNVLPSAMVQRVEVLRDGASSIYGSDAVAGVVNVITRTDIDGLELEVQGSAPEAGEGNSYRAAAVYGASGDRWRAAVSGEYYRREELTLRDRDFTSCPTDFRVTRAGARNDYIDPLTGQPKCFPIDNGGVTINTIATPYISENGAFGTIARPGVTPATNAESGFFFNRFRPNAAVTTGVVGFEGVGGLEGDAQTGLSLNIRDTFDDRMLNQSLISPVEVKTLFGQLSYDLQALGDATVYGEFLANSRESEQTGYRQLSLDYNYGSPLIPENLRFEESALPDQGTGNGQDVGIRAFIGYGNDRSSQTVDFWKGTAGIRGDLAFRSGWRYDAYVSHTRSDSEYTFESFLTNRLTNSLDAVTATPGVDSRLVRDGLTCRVNITDPNAGCIVAPPLNTNTLAGNLPADFRNYVFVPVTGTTQYTETVVSAVIDGPLFALPAGDVAAVVGVEYRRAEIDDTPPIDSQNGNLYNLTSATPTRGSDSVAEIFAELEAPLLRDQPFAHELTLSVSGRYTDYESYGADSTYKVGLLYAPVDWISLRATYGTSFRAPALFEQFLGGTSGFLPSTSDPCNEYGSRDQTSNRYQNCQAEIGDPAFRATTGVTVITAGGAEQGLEAETSSNFTGGIIVQPRLPEQFGNLSFAVDYYKIEIDNGVSRPGAGATLAACYDDPEFRAGGGLCNLIEARDPADGSLTVFDSYTNISSQVVEGIDWNIRYTRALGPGQLLVNGQLTQYLSQASRTFATDPLDEFNGEIGSPEYSATADVSYAMGDWRVRYGVEWLAATDSYERVGFTDADLQDPEFDYVFDTPDYFLHNASVQYSSDDWTVTGGVRNLFDEQPPLISSQAYSLVGNSPLYSGYDYVGRTFFLNLAKRF